MTDGLSIGVRFALYVDLMLLFGLPMFSLYALTESERADRTLLPLRTGLTVLGVAALLLSVLGLMAVCASMAGVSIAGLDQATVEMIVTQTPIGSAWLVRMAALAVSLLSVVAARRTEIALSISAAVALASLAWTGHGAAGEGTIGLLQLGADIGHLLAAGGWVGALAAFGMLLSRAQADQVHTIYRALTRFSVVGTIAVGVIVATGLVNSVFLIGITKVPTLASSLYGRLLIAKLALFGLMLGLAAANRFRLTPALARAMIGGNPRAAIGMLRRSLIIETCAAIIIIALVAWLGTLEPPMSM